jgi:hypothetical protein
LNDAQFPLRRKMEVALKLTENASLRGMQNEDGMWYFSVYDFINFVTGHELSSSYARTLFCRLVKNGSEHANEVASNCSYFQFPCQGQKSTPCMTIRGLQRLLMILGGKVAAEFRAIVESVFTRYTAGDTSLIQEVRANAASDAPENVIARQALEQEPVTLGKQLKRKMIDELDYAERHENLRRTRVDTVCKFAEVMSMLDENWKADTRLVQQTKDFCKNGLLSKQLLLTDGELCDREL